jgi:hypothetical protein
MTSCNPTVPLPTLPQVASAIRTTPKNQGM